MSIADGIDAVLLRPRVGRGQLCLVEPLDEFPDFPFTESNRAGPVECVPGFAFLITGHREGTVDLTVAVADYDLGADLSYDDIFEVSYYSPTGDISIEENSGEAYELPELSVGPHRLRYHLRMAADGKTAESVLLQIWPDEPGESAVLKATSPLARTWLEINPLESHRSAARPTTPQSPPEPLEPWPGDVTVELTPRVGYHQMYLLDRSVDDWDFPLSDANRAVLVACAADQAELYTGVALGPVNLSVTVADRDPGARVESYDDVFEVSFYSSTGDVFISGWGCTRSHDLPALAGGGGTYRLRYHARDYDELWDCGVAEPTGSYLLQIWPSPVHDSAILKKTSERLSHDPKTRVVTSPHATDAPAVPLPFNGLAERWSQA